MSIIADKIEVSDRLEENDINNIEAVIKEIHNRIENHKHYKLQLLNDKISIVCDKIINHYGSLPISCYEGRTIDIIPEAIPTLNLSDVVNNVLLIKFDNITIKYQCEPFEKCLDYILEGLNNKIKHKNKKLKYNIINDKKNVIKYIIVFKV